MTVPELLKAREEVQTSLEALNTYPSYNRGTTGSNPRVPLRAKLNAILQEIEAELTEQGYADA
jgi:hypothetical protein